MNDITIERNTVNIEGLDAELRAALAQSSAHQRRTRPWLSSI